MPPVKLAITPQGRAKDTPPSESAIVDQSVPTCVRPRIGTMMLEITNHRMARQRFKNAVHRLAAAIHKLNHMRVSTRVERPVPRVNPATPHEMLMASPQSTIELGQRRPEPGPPQNTKGSAEDITQYVER